MPDIPGIEKAKTMQTIGSRSMPPNMNQAYIDVFMLRKEKERLEKEGAKLDSKRELIVERLKKIEKELVKLDGKDKKSQEKRDFDWDARWERIGKVDNPKNPKKSKTGEESKKQPVKTGWKIKTLNTKRREF